MAVENPNQAPATEQRPMGWWDRVALAWQCFRQLRHEPACAGRIQDALKGRTAELPALEEARSSDASAPAEIASAVEAEAPPSSGSEGIAAAAVVPYDAASVSYALRHLQRHARLVDFAQQDIASFGDDDVGAAARVVHAGLGKALNELGALERVVEGVEGEGYAVAADYDPRQMKLTGEPVPEPPSCGTLRHAGWRIHLTELPSPLPEHDATILAQAEVDFGGS